MLFNSLEFIFIFLPIVLLLFYSFAYHQKHQESIFILVIASLFFYAWWNPIYLSILVFSILFNYLVSRGLTIEKLPDGRKKRILIGGVSGNLMLLLYFKYAGFFVDNLNKIQSYNFNIGEIILPLAISFFTFQQIAFLVDTYRGKCKEFKFIHYTLFVTFFPQLIAGPIVHHKEMMPQFKNFNVIRKYAINNFWIGFTIFNLGLFKKVVLADGISQYSTPVFDAAAHGTILTFFEAWFGVLSYTAQLYFDFSGYSDMAIGLARMFGISIPLNFHSPYKAVNIIDFWRRWHMTLSRFLKDYLYIPLGGNRKGKLRRYINLMVTMLLAGLWHGANWNFVVWGGLHGLYIVINHGWHRIRCIINCPVTETGADNNIFRILSIAFTFFLVVLTWVPFRAKNIDISMSIFGSMFGMHGISLPSFFKNINEYSSLIIQGLDLKFNGMFYHGLADFSSCLFYLPLLLIIIFALPNSQEYMGDYASKLNIYEQHNISHLKFFNWKPTFISGALFGGMIFIIATKWITVSPSEFLYFNF